MVVLCVRTSSSAISGLIAPISLRVVRFFSLSPAMLPKVQAHSSYNTFKMVSENRKNKKIV